MQVATATASQGTAASAAGRALTSDFQTFLRMLTTQMENQDPLNPIKSEEFAVQLATFSGVEQQVRTNELLAGLAARLGATSMAQMAGWIGMEARAAMPARFEGAPIEIAPRAGGEGDRHDLVVRDSSGDAIWRQAIAADGTALDWAGTAPDGAPLPAGLYRFSVESFAGGELVATEPVEVYGRVTEARQGAEGIELVFDGGAHVAAGEVTAVRAPVLQAG